MLLPFLCMTGMPSVCGESPQGAQLPMNPKATPGVCFVRRRWKEGTAKPQPDGQKPDTKALMAKNPARNERRPEDDGFAVHRDPRV